jgi:hypothetical protein
MAEANTDITSDAAFYALLSACSEAWRTRVAAPERQSGDPFAYACDLEQKIIEVGVTTAQALVAKIKAIRAAEHDQCDLDHILECLERDAERIAARERVEPRRDLIAGTII